MNNYPLSKRMTWLRDIQGPPQKKPHFDNATKKPPFFSATKKTHFWLSDRWTTSPHLWLRIIFSTHRFRFPAFFSNQALSLRFLNISAWDIVKKELSRKGGDLSTTFRAFFLRLREILVDIDRNRKFVCIAFRSHRPPKKFGRNAKSGMGIAVGKGGKRGGGRLKSCHFVYLFGSFRVCCVDPFFPPR